MVKQSQESLSSLPVLYRSEDSQILKYNPVQEGVQLWATLTDKDTVFVYQQAVEKTCNIFKQAIAVIFFLCQLTIALIIWVSGLSFQLGQIFRNKLEVEQPNLAQIISAVLQFLLWPLQLAYNWAASFIKQYLGWDNPLITNSPAIKPKEIPASGETTKESSSTNLTI